MLLTVSFVVVLFLGVSGSIPTEEANDYVDRVLAGKFQEGILQDKLDPAPLGDIRIDWNSSATTPSPNFGNNFAFLQNGTLRGLGNVERSGNCWSYGNYVLNCGLVFRNLKLYFAVSATIRGSSYVGGYTFYANATINETYLSVKIQYIPDAKVPNMTQFRVFKIGKIITWPGIGEISGDFKGIETSLRPLVNGALKPNVESDFNTILNGRFKQVLAKSISDTPYKNSHI